MESDAALVQTTIGFGDDFELDPEARQLRRAGRVVRLERIPFDILQLLAEHAGRVVTRDQIVDAIWGKDVFLDTDNSINGAIRKIRLVLKDHPEKPAFIETLPGTGYRFIAPVRRASADPTSPAPDSPPNASVDPVGPAPAAGRAVSHRWVLTVAAGCALAIAAVAWQSGRGPVPPASDARVMLAVLPFENLTGDPEQEYFSDGLTEELIAHLGRLEPNRLGVIARTSVMRFKRTSKDLDLIGQELGVQYVLEGSVRRDSSRLRIAAQLVQVADRTHVWARQYDRELQSVLSVQGEIAEAVAREIEVALGAGYAQRAAPASLSPQGYEAYDLYLRGRYHWNKRTREGFKQAVDSFAQALAIDPNHARAHAGLADTYALMGTYGHAPQDEILPKAKAAALRALEIDDGLAEAHTSLALVSESHDRDWRRTEAEFRRAIELDPNYATAHQWYAEYLSFQGRSAEALAEIGRARTLDPLSLIVATDHGAICYFARQYDCAIAQFRAVIAVEPNFPRANLIISAHLQKGQFDAALAQVERTRRLGDAAWTWAWTAHTYGRTGKTAEAREALRRMEEANRTDKMYAPALYATAYVGMGDHDRAFAALQTACEDRSFLLMALKVDPIFDPLRADPRFAELLRCARVTS